MDDLELIKERVSVVDLISEYLPLKKAGINFKANCPFHQEHTPSFMVSPERGIWHCFGCSRGGDIFKFVMEKEGIDFKESLDILAQKAGVVLKHQDKPQEDGVDKLYLVNQKAAQFFHYMLTTHPLGKKALEYLKSRGLTDKTIEQFNLGYAPNSWESLTGFLQKRGFSTKDQILSGICVPSRRGCYDRFRGRVMFPLVDVRNRIIGFSGRILGSGEPKYINTPQTPIFDKSKLLFGLNLSKGEIKTKMEAILVEGEMDMILSFQSGVTNIVSSKGTALTEDQIDIIKRYAGTISLSFDTDLAGDAASRRGIEMADRAGLNIKVIMIEGGKDAAEVCLQNPKSWIKAVEESIPIYDYYLESVTKRFDLKKAASKKAIFAELLPIWAKITDPITRDHYTQKLAALLQIKEDFITKEIDSLQIQLSKPTSFKAISQITEVPTEIPKPLDRRRLLEGYLISLILHIPQSHTYIPHFPETLLTQEELRQVYVLLVLFLDGISFKGQSFKISEFVKSVPEEMIGVIDRLFLMQIDEKLTESRHWQKELDCVVSELKKMLIKTSLEKLSMQIKTAQEFDKIELLEVLNRRFRDLSVKLKNL